jgi:uroporphyrinogen decarboxylase
MLSVDNADLLRRLLHPITDRIIELMHAQMDAGARYVHVAEPTGSLLSPRAFAEIGLPSIQQLFSHVAVPNHIHMCGDTNGHLDVLAHAGAGAMSVDSMVNMKEAARIFGKHMAVCGNIEATGVLLHGSPEEVESATRSMLKDMASVENYIPASSCGIPAHTPAENIDIFVKTVRSYVDF